MKTIRTIMAIILLMANMTIIRLGNTMQKTFAEMEMDRWKEKGYTPDADGSQLMWKHYEMGKRTKNWKPNT